MAKSGDNVTGWIISLLILVVLIVVSLVITGNLQDTTLVDQPETITVVNFNVAGAFTNDTGVNFANDTIVNYKDISCSLFNLTNRTSGAQYNASNYTIGGAGNCFITGVAGSMFNSSSFNSTFSFTHNTFTAPDSLITNFSTGVLTFGTFFNVLFTAAAIFGVLAIFLAVLLFLVKVTNKIRGKGSSKYGEM